MLITSDGRKIPFPATQQSPAGPIRPAVSDSNYRSAHNHTHTHARSHTLAVGRKQTGFCFVFGSFFFSFGVRMKNDHIRLECWTKLTTHTHTHALHETLRQSERMECVFFCLGVCDDDVRLRKYERMAPPNARGGARTAVVLIAIHRGEPNGRTHTRARALIPQKGLTNVCCRV